MSEQYCQRSLVDTVALVACSSYLTAVTTLKLNVAIREHEINTSTHTQYALLRSTVHSTLCLCLCLCACACACVPSNMLSVFSMRLLELLSAFCLGQWPAIFAESLLGMSKRRIKALNISRQAWKPEFVIRTQRCTEQVQRTNRMNAESLAFECLLSMLLLRQFSLEHF